MFESNPVANISIFPSTTKNNPGARPTNAKENGNETRLCGDVYPV
jgi:hypothetical protein